MSARDLKSFMSKIDKDPALRKKVRGTVTRITKVAKEHGYEFSEAELRNHLREKWGMKAAPNYDAQHDTCFFA